MRKVLAVTLACLLPVASVLAAPPGGRPDRQSSVHSAPAGPMPGPLSLTAAREVTRLTAGPRVPDQPSNQPRRSWRARHPALMGAIVGAGIGAPVALATPEFACGGGDENCLFGTAKGALIGAGIGAGVGSLVGWIGSLACR